MYIVDFYVHRFYDTMLGEYREGCFSGAVFESLEEIADWQAKNLTDEDHISTIFEVATNKVIYRYKW